MYLFHLLLTSRIKTHTHTHTHTHARTHARTRTHAHTHTHCQFGLCDHSDRHASALKTCDHGSFSEEVILIIFQVGKGIFAFVRRSYDVEWAMYAIEISGAACNGPCVNIEISGTARNGLCTPLRLAGHHATGYVRH